MSKKFDLAELKEPFPPDQISWRVGSTNSDKTKGMALAYINARDVMQRLDEVVGPENWQDDYDSVANRVICHLSIRIDGEWVRKSDGAGDTDFEPEKGGLSDAFKRAAVKWSIGRYLYDLDSPWVQIEPAGRSYKIKKDDQARLKSLLPSPTEKGKPAADNISKEEWQTLLAEVKARNVSLDALQKKWKFKKGSDLMRSQYQQILREVQEQQQGA